MPKNLKSVKSAQAGYLDIGIFRFYDLYQTAF